MNITEGAPKSVMFDGLRYTRNRQGYWRSTGRGRSGPRMYLHRAIYEAHHGPLKPGQVVHHIDQDASNNRPANLAAMLREDHTILHTPERMSRPQAEGWSEVVRERVGQGLRRAWARGRNIIRECSECGAEFLSQRGGLTCSTKCGNKRRYRAWYRRNRKGGNGAG